MVTQNNDKKLSVIIGIPAYNEGQNIKNLLTDLLAQDTTNFELQKIIVTCDNCSDNTALEANSLNSPLIEVWDNKDRLGQAGRQNEILTKVDCDVLILLNADILPYDDKFLFNLVEPTYKHDADLVAAKIIPSKADTLFCSIIHASVRAKNSVFETYKDGHNLYTCHGTSRAFTKKLYRQLDFKKVVAEDAYSYLTTVTNGMKYYFAEDAIAFYKLPSNLKDHIRQSSRFLNGIDELHKYFTQDQLDEAYYYPKDDMIKALIDEFVHNPFLITSYFFILAYVKVKENFKKDKAFSGVWESVSSTKAPVKQI